MAEKKRTSFFARLMGLDRRIIFVILALGIIIPLRFPIMRPIRVTKEVREVFEMVDTLAQGDIILLDLDYAPDTMAELEPMAYAVIRHCYAKGVRLITCCLFSTGVSLIESELKTMAEENGKVYGEDYVYLGYRPYPATVILSMGQDFRQSFPIDFYGTSLDSLPMMQGVKNYRDVKMVLSINATSGVDYWIMYGRERYNFPLAFGVTAVMAADYYSYLQSGQIKGIIGGLKGAAEYERLVDRQDRATLWMNIQSIVHVIIVLFIIIGNVGYFLSRRRSEM